MKRPGVSAPYQPRPNYFQFTFEYRPNHLAFIHLFRVHVEGIGFGITVLDEILQTLPPGDRLEVGSVTDEGLRSLLRKMRFQSASPAYAAQRYSRSV